jgi:hypothetical protein
MMPSPRLVVEILIEVQSFNASLRMESGVPGQLHKCTDQVADSQGGFDIKGWRWLSATLSESLAECRVRHSVP